MPHEPHADLTNETTAEGGTPLRLGVLDLCQVTPGGSARQALFDCLEAAAGAEMLGYSRYWLAEHHGPGVAHSSPELLAGLVAQMTERIRVGTAGVLLNYYSPLKVAKDFRLLQALFPGRIDLGVGAGGVDGETARGLLGPGAHPGQEYGDKVDLLAGYLRDESPVAPQGVGAPELWVLGSGGAHSPRAAARNGTAFSLSLFLPGSGDPAAVAEYRSHFRPGAGADRPRWNIAVAAICAETEEEALRLKSRHKNPYLVPTVVGDPGRCRAMLEDLSDLYRTNEIVIVAIGATPQRRLRTYELLARVFELEPVAV